MITLKNIGEFKSVPQLVKDIIEGDTLALDQYLASGWDIDQEIEISKYTSLSPIDLSLITGNFDSLKWLVEKGAHLNVKITLHFCWLSGIVMVRSSSILWNMEQRFIV